MAKSKAVKGKKVIRASDHGKQHQNKKKTTKLTAKQFAEKHVEMPDGAFWALAEEYGFYPEDFTK